MHQSGSVSLCRSAISVLVATALYSPIALASTVEYGETVDGVVLEKDIQLVYGTANNTKINPGGEQHIKEFGVSSNTEINGGYQYIEMNGTAEYSVLNDGYQIVQMGGAANQTTINNGVLQVYGAATDPTIKGGRLIVEKDGIAVFAVIEKGGLLEVKATGDFKIFVTDTGASPAAGDSLTLVTTGGGDAAFTLGNAGGVVDIGTYEYTLLDNGNHSWSLAENRAQITPSTTDVLNMAAAQPLVFDAELDTVRERLGSVKGVSYDTAMWSSAINTRNNVTTDAGAGFEQTLTGLTLGIDSRFSREESSTIRGLFFGYSHSDIGFDRGGKGNIDSYTLGAYAGWEHQNGAYVDGVVKVDRFANIIHGKMSNGATAFGDYNSNGAGAHVESGFRWVDGLWSVRPYLAFTGFTTDGQDYTLSNGMRADVGNTRILRAEAGTAVSYHMDLQNGTTLEPWLKAAVRQEYADSNQVKVNDDGKFNNDVAGTRGVYQAGIRSSFTPTLSGHLSVSYGNGAGVESPWNTQAGVVWTF